MTECCSEIKDIGCFYSCDIVQIGELTPVTGLYTLELQPDSIKVVQTTNTAGQPLIFSGGYLNEDRISVFKIIKPDGTYYETSDGEDCFQVSVKPTVNPALADLIVDPVTCASASAVLKNTAGTVISTTTIASGASSDITAPDATAVLKNTDGDVIDTEAIPSNVSEDIVIANVAWTNSDGGAESTPYGDAIVCDAVVNTVTIFFNPIAIGNDTSGLMTNNSGVTLTLTALAQDGASGTITVSVNGGAYAAFVNPTSLLNGQTLQVKRTVTTGVGSVTITGTHA